MKKILIEYSNIIGYTIIGLVFGFSFFLLFINLYHYKEVNRSFEKQDTDYQVNQEISDKLNGIKENINNFDINSYKGSENAYSLSSIKSRLSICVQKVDTDELKKLLTKKTLNISDVYKMQQFYQVQISNECLVKELYDLTINDGNNNLQISSLPSMAPFFEDNIKQLIKSTDYIQKNLKNNGSYYFSSDTSKVDIYDETKDSYYSILNNYVSAIDFIYDVSVWFENISGGNV